MPSRTARHDPGGGAFSRVTRTGLAGPAAAGARVTVFAAKLNSEIARRRWRIPSVRRRLWSRVRPGPGLIQRDSWPLHLAPPLIVPAVGCASGASCASEGENRRLRNYRIEDARLDPSGEAATTSAAENNELA